MDAGTVIGVAVAAAVVISLVIFITLWICRRNRKRDGVFYHSSIDSTTSYREILEQSGLEQNDRELAVESILERKKGVGFYEGSSNDAPKNPPPKR